MIVWQCPYRDVAAKLTPRRFHPYDGGCFTLTREGPWQNAKTTGAPTI
uniref:Uncharacterized protein n=1 Tax=Podoviridae sp. ct7gc4 TaxID=2826542 RepID=A0A8S5NJI5_9CAUD|nr:MAG TPA: hypothetical protein [Podoviridae sp. ct7gc4]